MKESNYLGIDIGGSAIKYGWGNCQRGLLSFERLVLADNSLQTLQAGILHLLKSVDKSFGIVNISGIGVGIPGTIDFKTGKIVGVNPNLPGCTNLDPKSLFPDELVKMVSVDNDANLMALAEAERLPDCSNVIGITIGSGIGCGFVQNGEIYHGAHGYAMEVGHITIKENGAKCNCGRYGCLEAYTSVNGLINLIKSTLPHLKPKTIKDIFDLAKEENIIEAYLNDSIACLSVAIANLAIVFDADAIAIGGGVVELPEYPFAVLQKKILDLIPEPLKNQIIVSKAFYGNQAGVIGGITLSEKQDKRV